jgi:inner membrane protein
MDPITQATLGAMASVAVLGKRTPLGLTALASIGAVGGAAADLDVLIRSSDDPLLTIEYHRHFTHSLAFIPVGGVLSALPWLTWSRARQCFRWVLLASTLGYATHALLDACTTYGTLLFWPLSMTRVSVRLVSVIDLLFTLPLIALLVESVRRGTMLFST